MNKIRQGDEIIVLTGKDKGRRGTVLQIFKDRRVLVEGINVSKKHTKPTPNAGIEGGILDKEMPIDASNVMLWNPETKKGDRVSFRKTDSGSKERIFLSTGKATEI